MEAKGINGQLELTADVVRIRRKGMMSLLTQGAKGDKDILISQVTSVQFKAANMLTNGYIQIGFSGGKESKGGLMDAVKDENTVMFKRGQQETFEAFRDELNRRMLAARKPAASAPAPLDFTAQLERLARLREQGVLTDEEFQAQKARVLGG
ncbi:MAG: hypothetical protein AVDCRST_MAG89-2984 [uncultured Gemmatimonadetes bacterium]|uniref:SHOCT domain-containing protein n=1 Tax=uncultured Gemmatimonadota bacterium TaxID=203437 RepID=A0A6J4M803_9BACT|nr:MAG: hypothetical protein AVDCRST_MAG89-2984 [uncultured Gemmatimonadota bacterium]